jgi:predicted transcriptional regulator of viral defense system
LPITFTPAEVESRGMSRRKLRQLEQSGAVERIGHGLYRLVGAEPVDHDLLEIALKARQPTLCLVSALARHELTDIVPAVHDVAVPRGVWRPVVSAPVRWHKFDVNTFAVGRTEIPIEGRQVLGLYDAPQSIIDAFRLRHAIGVDVANEALRRWLRRGGRPTDLIRLTKIFPAARLTVLRALQVLL